MCKKTFKKEGQLNNHLQSKQHKRVAAMLKEEIGLDEETENKIKELNQKKAADDEETKDSCKKPEVLEELDDEQIADIDDWVHKSKNKEKGSKKKNEKNKG